MKPLPITVGALTAVVAAGGFAVGQGIVHQPPPLPVGAAPAQDPLVQFVPASNSSPDANTSPETPATTWTASCHRPRAT